MAKAPSADGASTPEGPKNIIEREGKLIELDLAAVAVVREPKGEREIFYAMLSHYARSRGYKAGWAGLNFNDRYGYFPNTSMRRLMPIPPDDSTMAWIHSKLGDYAKQIVKHGVASRISLSGGFQ